MKEKEQGCTTNNNSMLWSKEEMYALSIQHENPPSIVVRPQHEDSKDLSEHQNHVHKISAREAWLQVFFGHLLNFNTFGYMLSFGIFQGYYTTVLGLEPSKVSWIGTVQLFLNLFIGVFSGRALDAGYYRITLTAGIFLQLLAVFTTSFSTKYYQLFLAQGLCQGLGNGLLFCPSIALVSTYFPRRHKALALSFVACGGATGGMVFPAIAQSLLPKIGFAWTVRVMGFVMFTASAISWPFSRTHVKPPRNNKNALIDTKALKEIPFMLYSLGIFFGYWGLYFAFYYVRPFSQNVLKVSDRSSFDTILMINSFGLPGRIVPAILADRLYGSLNVLIPFMLLNGILMFCWISVKTPTGFFVWVAFYGFFAGASQSLFQSASVKFSPSSKVVGVRMGMVCTLVSFACLTGPPIAGKLIEMMEGRYLAAQLFGGCSLTVGSISLLVASFVQTRNDRSNNNIHG